MVEVSADRVNLSCVMIRGMGGSPVDLKDKIREFGGYYLNGWSVGGGSERG